jgi:asparagine synthase (glutamine-hydrolysing)
VATFVDRLPRGITGRIRVGRASLAEAAHRRRLADPRVLDHAGLRATQGDAADLLESFSSDPLPIDRGFRPPRTPRAPWDGPATRISSERELMAADFRTYLPDDPLTKVDRATMSVGLEHRAPMLGRDVIAAAARLRTNELFDRNGGRAPIRAALRSLNLPDGGAKRGFAVPIFDWLRGPLRDHAASLLLDPANDPLSEEATRRVFDDVQRGRRDRATACWTAMCWRAWLRSRD